MLLDIGAHNSTRNVPLMPELFLHSNVSQSCFNDSFMLRSLFSRNLVNQPSPSKTHLISCSWKPPAAVGRKRRTEINGDVSNRVLLKNSNESNNYSNYRCEQKKAHTKPVRSEGVRWKACDFYRRRWIRLELQRERSFEFFQGPFQGPGVVGKSLNETLR